MVHSWLDYLKKRTLFAVNGYSKRNVIPMIEKIKYKAKLVAKGYNQSLGIDFIYVFSPII